MLYPISISEQLLFTTVRLQTKEKTGTGFFFRFNVGGTQVPVIFTNKHVVSNNPSMSVSFQVHTGDVSNKVVDDQSITINLETKWVFHDTLDVCFCYAAPLINHVRNQLSKSVFYIPITEDYVPSQSQLDDLNAIEKVIMVGYPKGLWDTANNLPLFRSGITSSHPSLDFNMRGQGVVDMACYPGSSGSPIFILDEAGYSSKVGSTVFGKKRLYFLGVLFSGPTTKTKVTALDEELTEAEKELYSKTMINLGYYVKASELLNLKSKIQLSPPVQPNK